MEKRFKDKKEELYLSNQPAEEPEKPLLTDIADFLKDTKTIVPLAIIGIFLLAFVAFLQFAKPFVMPILLAVILSFVLKPVVNVLSNFKIPRWMGSLVVIVSLMCLIGIIFSHLMQPARDWMANYRY